MTLYLNIQKKIQSNHSFSKDTISFVKKHETMHIFRDLGKIFVICKGVNEFYNPEHSYRKAKEPVFRWKEETHTFSEALAYMYEFGTWIGVAVPNGMVILDIDQPEDVKTMLQNKSEYIEPNAVYRTHNGFHVWFKVQSEFEKKITNTHYVLQNGMKATVRKNGSYVIIYAPGEKVQEGNEYKIYPENSKILHVSTRYWMCYNEIPELEKSSVFQFQEFGRDSGLNFQQEKLNLQQESTNSVFSDISSVLPFVRPASKEKKNKYQIVEEITEKYYNLLPQDVKNIILSTAPENGYDYNTTLIKKVIQHKCEKKGERHHTYLKLGNRAGFLKLSLKEIRSILYFSRNYTTDIVRTANTFMRGYVYSALKLDQSLHMLKLKKRRRNISPSQREENFKKEQFKKIYDYLISLDQVPQYVTTQDLKKAGVLCRGKGLGSSCRVYINGVRTRIRFLNTQFIRQVKRRNISFEEKFMKKIFMFKKIPEEMRYYNIHPTVLKTARGKYGSIGFRLSKYMKEQRNEKLQI